MGTVKLNVHSVIRMTAIIFSAALLFGSVMRVTASEKTLNDGANTAATGNTKDYSVGNIIESDCDMPGSYDKVFRSDDGFVISRETVTVPPVGHAYMPVSYEPTCTEAGYTVFTCENCGDVYTEAGDPALGHDCEAGSCARCGWKDPNHLSSERIVEILEESLVADSGTFRTYRNGDKIGVFGEDITGAFSVNTGSVLYSVIEGNKGSVVFNISELAECVDVLNFKIGGETGSMGKMTVEIWIDRREDEKPNYTYKFECSDMPAVHSVNIEGKTSMRIRVTNRSFESNRAVLFDFFQGE